MEIAILTAKLALGVKLLSILTLVLLLPMIGVALLFNILQSAMQLTDSSLSLLPKLLTLGLTVVVSWSFISTELHRYFVEILYLASAGY
jgi:flagellar biosynthesis protein FliQ